MVTARDAQNRMRVDDAARKRTAHRYNRRKLANNPTVTLGSDALALTGRPAWLRRRDLRDIRVATLLGALPSTGSGMMLLDRRQSY